MLGVVDAVELGELVADRLQPEVGAARRLHRRLRRRLLDVQLRDRLVHLHRTLRHQLPQILARLVQRLVVLRRVARRGRRLRRRRRDRGDGGRGGEALLRALRLRRALRRAVVRRRRRPQTLRKRPVKRTEQLLEEGQQRRGIRVGGSRQRVRRQIVRVHFSWLRRKPASNSAGQLGWKRMHGHARAGAAAPGSADGAAAPGAVDGAAAPGAAGGAAAPPLTSCVVPRCVAAPPERAACVSVPAAGRRRPAPSRVARSSISR